MLYNHKDNTASPSVFHKYLMAFMLLVFAYFLFSQVSKPGWNYGGDTLNFFGPYSYHYSGIVRGEYALWNPLVRAGEPEDLFQALQLASPTLNMVALISNALRINDIVLSYTLYVFVCILLYVYGVYLLVGCWTKDQRAGAFASILALGSATVFWYGYHINFVLIIHAIPWFLYSITMYFRKFEFKYMIILILSYSVALYSYEFVMGLLFLLVLGISAAIFFYKDLRKLFGALKQIPARHWIASGILMFLITFPQILIFYDMETGKYLSASNRLTEVRITDQYTVESETSFSRRGYGPRLRKPITWLTFFTGINSSSVRDLRYYIGPIVAPFLVVALFSFKKIPWCIALSGFFILCLSADRFPLNLFYKLPAFSLIRNTHFLFNFLIFVSVIIAGYGFHFYAEDASLRLKRTFKAAVMILLITYLICILPLSYLNYNLLGLFISSAAMVVFLVICFFQKSSYRHTSASILILTSVVTIAMYNFIFIELPIMGGIYDDPVMQDLRKREDHSLKFLFERPDQIERFDDRYAIAYNIDFGMDEYYSLASLEDNSYKSIMGRHGMAGFPVLRDYYLFMSLPGHEQLMRRKFFFFNKYFVSKQAKDMMAFKNDPGLLASMIDRGVGMVDQVENKDPKVFLGLFHPDSIEGIPVEKGENGLDIEIIKYNANSIRFNVSVDQRGLLTYTDMWDEGWRARVDGSNVPVRKVFHTFKGIDLSPGIHDIEFFYKSNVLFSIITMNTVSFLLLGWLIVLILFHRFKPKRMATT